MGSGMDLISDAFPSGHQSYNPIRAKRSELKTNYDVRDATKFFRLSFPFKQIGRMKFFTTACYDHIWYRNKLCPESRTDYS